MRKHKYVAITIAVSGLACQMSAKPTRLIPPQKVSVPTSAARPRPEELCDRLADLKILPFKGEPVNDAVYNGLMKQGEAVIPCLIEKLTDTTVMTDPRQAPRYVGFEFRVGDAAYVMLMSIANDMPFEEMLSDEAKQEWKTEGMYAYFAYMEENAHRFEVQNRWRLWFAERQQQ